MAMMIKCPKCGFYYLDETCSCGVIKRTALREVLELIEEDKTSDYIGAEKHIANTGGVILTIQEPICFAAALKVKIEEMIKEV